MLLVVCLSLIPEPISLDTLTVERGRALNGRLVVATFIVATPPYLQNGCTGVGAADLGDGIERGAVLRGRRLDVRQGERLGVAGVLRVVSHPPALVGNSILPGWVELRVSDPRK